MLEFLRIPHPDQIKSLLKDFNPSTQTWIVSDLKSKQEIQAECITRFGFYADDSVLRISDFWRIWIRRLKPTLQVVSGDFIRSLVQMFIQQHGALLELNEGDQSTLEKYVQELAPIILHPQSDTILHEWLEAQANPRKWKRWYQIARACLLFIVNGKKVIDVRWSAAYLQCLDLEKIHWPQEIIVDLGTELTSVEMGLFKVLSQKQKVQIYVPYPAWQARFPFLLKTYTENLGYGSVKDAVSTVTNSSPKTFLRLSTQLAEVKFAVSQVRRWLDEGVDAQRIAVITVQIEDYWPVLQSYLAEEGVPYQKDLVAPVNGLSDVQSFLAHLESLTTDVSFESLQQKVFHASASPAIAFEKFKSLFNQLFSEEDLKRDEQVQALFYKKIDFTKELRRDEFITILLKVWGDLPEKPNSSTLFELLFKDFLSQSLDTSLLFASWLQFFKARLSRKEMKLSFAGDNGIHVLSLMSAQLTPADYRIYIGLTEEAFRAQKKSVLPLADVEALKTQFDLAIPYPEESHLDFNLRWQAESGCQQLILTSPHLSFSAEPLTPCLYFLEHNPKSEMVAPGFTRLDEKQKYLAQAQAESVEEYEDHVAPGRLKQDWAGSHVQVMHPVFQRLSASEIENYSQCSFKLLASKGFRLRELPEVSIDLDPRQRGTLVHALFEFLIQQVEKSELDLEAVKSFLNAQRKEMSLFVHEDSFWQVQLNKLMSLAQKFIEFERFRVQQFKVATELPFEIYFDPDQGMFVNENRPHSILIRGRIDRLDQDKKTGHVLIYDYKSSVGQISNHDKWISQRQFQLLLYLFAVEVSLFKDSEVKGALYYLYKNFDVTKGLVDQKFALENLHFSSRAGSLVDEDDFTEVKAQFMEFITECFARLQKGDFTPRPFDKTICANCDWRKMCRAAHLM